MQTMSMTIKISGSVDELIERKILKLVMYRIDGFEDSNTKRGREETIKFVATESAQVWFAFNVNIIYIQCFHGVLVLWCLHVVICAQFISYSVGLCVCVCFSCFFVLIDFDWRYKLVLILLIHTVDLLPSKFNWCWFGIRFFDSNFSITSSSSSTFSFRKKNHFHTNNF